MFEISKILSLDVDNPFNESKKTSSMLSIFCLKLNAKANYYKNLH